MGSKITKKVSFEFPCQKWPKYCNTDFLGTTQLKYPFFQSLKEAFKIFDKNGNGYIEAKELKSVTTTLGSMLTEEEFDAFWEEADVNHDGKLDYEEFIKIMSQY